MTDSDNTILPFQIILESERILAVSKPGGLLTQAPSGIDSLEARIKKYLAEKQTQIPAEVRKSRYQPKQKSGGVYLGVPHRLDRPATGAIVFAKDKKAARFLSEQFQRREVRKIYWTLVSGRSESEAGTWQDWMRKIPDEAKSEICQEGDEGAQSAVLHYQVLNHDPSTDRSLLKIDLETGRSHQIRLQAASRGMPIVGDHLYGSTVLFGPQTEDQRDRWIGLLARELVVVDPGTKEPVVLTAEIPESWGENLSLSGI